MGGLAFDLWGVLSLVEAASMYPSNSEGWQLCGREGVGTGCWSQGGLLEERSKGRGRNVEELPTLACCSRPYRVLPPMGPESGSHKPQGPCLPSNSGSPFQG